jgi:hypothetical protein
MELGTVYRPSNLPEISDVVIHLAVFPNGGRGGRQSALPEPFRGEFGFNGVAAFGASCPFPLAPAAVG